VNLDDLEFEQTTEVIARASLTPTSRQLSILPPGEGIGEGDLIHVDDARVMRDWASGKSIHTRRLYRRIVLGLFRSHPGKRLFEFRKHELERHLDERARTLGSLDSLKTEAQVLKSLFSFAHKDGAITRSPAALIRRAGTPVEVRLQKRSMTRDETELLIFHAGSHRDRVLFKLLYATGARVSEIAGREWRHLQSGLKAEARLQVIGKGGRPGFLKIPPVVYQELLSLRLSDANSSDPIFAHHQDPKRSMTTEGIWERVKVAAARASIFKPVSPHWFRHANASHALAAGCPLPVVRDTLRHASIATTSAYAHAQEGSSSADYLNLSSRSISNDTKDGDRDEDG
jgi:integrase/recombinase XerD